MSILGTTSSLSDSKIERIMPGSLGRDHGSLEVTTCLLGPGSLTSSHLQQPIVSSSLDTTT